MDAQPAKISYDYTIATDNIFVPWEIKIDQTNNFKDQIMESSKLEVNENSKEMPRTISSNISRKIKKRRQGCDSFWMHNEHEVKSCTITTDDFITNWEVIMDKKSWK